MHLSVAKYWRRKDGLNNLNYGINKIIREIEYTHVFANLYFEQSLEARIPLITNTSYSGSSKDWAPLDLTAFI